MVTTVTDNSAARSVAPLAGNVVWSSAIATTDKTVATTTVTIQSADGLSRTVSADYDGDGTYEHSETWQAGIDGSQTAIVTDVNASSVVVARGLETVSADGLTCRLIEDSNNDGLIDHYDTAVTHIDGSKTETTTDLNSDGTLNKTVVTTVGANGQTVATNTTNGTAPRPMSPAPARTPMPAASARRSISQARPTW